jgi:hypothetical protein
LSSFAIECVVRKKPAGTAPALAFCLSLLARLQETLLVKDDEDFRTQNQVQAIAVATWCSNLSRRAGIFVVEKIA